MRPTRRDDAHRRATRVYRWIVRLYPAAYRRLFGEQMLQTFQDHYRDTVATREESETRFWLGVVTDETKAIPRARLAAMQEAWRRWSSAALVTQDRQETISMTRFLVKLVKYWYLYLIPLLLIPTAATIYGLRKESTYESTASLFVTKQTIIKSLGPQDENIYATTAQNVSDQVGQLLQSTSFLIHVAQDTSLNANHSLDTPPGQAANASPTPAQSAASGRIWGHISVSANSTRNLVFITSDDKDPRVAQELTNAVIKEFNVFYADLEGKYLQAAQGALKQQRDDIKTKLDKDTQERDDYQSKHPNVNNAVAAASDSTWQTLVNQVNADVASQTSITSDYDQVSAQLLQVSAGTPYDLQTQDPAILPTGQTVKVSKLIIYPIGALVGLLVLFAVTGISYRSRVAPE